MRSFKVISPATTAPHVAAGSGDAGAGHTQSDQVIKTQGPARRSACQRPLTAVPTWRPGKEEDSASLRPGRLHAPEELRLSLQCVSLCCQGTVTSRRAKRCQRRGSTALRPPQPSAAPRWWRHGAAAWGRHGQADAPAPQHGLGELQRRVTPWPSLQRSSSQALLNISPASAAQPQAPTVPWHMAFRRRRATKIHCKLMFYRSIYIKRVFKAKKPSTLSSRIQNNCGSTGCC